MDISLNPKLEQFVEEKVKSGDYASASDMVNGALILLQDHEALLPSNPTEVLELRRKIALGIEQLDRGEGTAWDTEEIKAEGRRRLAKNPDQS